MASPAAATLGFGVAGIALGRDLNDDGAVDVLGAQLEEVVE